MNENLTKSTETLDHRITLKADADSSKRLVRNEKCIESPIDLVRVWCCPATSRKDKYARTVLCDF